MKLRMPAPLFPFAPTLLLVLMVALWICCGNVPLELWASRPSIAASLAVDWKRAGFEFSLDGRGWALQLPFWFLCAVAAVPLAVQLRRRAHAAWRDHQVSKLLCPTCGYDLRASPEQCPECGTILPAEPAPRLALGLPARARRIG